MDVVESTLIVVACNETNTRQMSLNLYWQLSLPVLAAVTQTVQQLSLPELAAITQPVWQLLLNLYQPLL